MNLGVKIFLRAAFPLLALVLAGSASAAQWAEFKTENFLIYSDADPELVQGLAEDLEVFRSYLIKLTNVDEGFIAEKKTAGVDRRFVVYGFKNTASYTNLTGSEKLSFSVSHPRGIVSFVNFGVHPDPYEGKRGKPGREDLFYEYTQYFIKQYSNFNYPIWYIRGLALYLSTFTVEDGVADVGLAPLRTIKVLSSSLSHHLLPIEDVLGSTREYTTGILNQGEAVDWNSFSGVGLRNQDLDGSVIDHNHSSILNPETLKVVLKYQSWGVVHYLQSDPGRRQKMIDYLMRLNSGENFEDAFSAVFDQDMKVFSEQVYAYTERKLFPSLQLEFQTSEEPAVVEKRTLSDAEAGFVTAEAKSYLLDQKKRLFAIKNQLMDVAGDFRDEAETIVAEMEYFTGKPDKAEDILGTILERTPGFGRANGLLGAVLLEKGDIAKARSRLRRALRENPNDLVALYMLGHSYIVAPEGNVEEGVNVLARANLLYPQDEQIRLELAMLDVVLGNQNYAYPALENLSMWGSNAAIRNQAQSCLDNLKQGWTCSLPLVAAQ